MLTNVKTPIRMFLGAGTGLSAAVAGLLIFAGFLPGIFGGSINPLWVISGVILAVVFPFFLGMTNVNWLRSLIISLIAPIAIWTLNGMFSGLSINSARLFNPLLFDSTAIQASLRALALVGFIEILTLWISKKRFLGPLIGMGTGLLIVLFIDGIRFGILQTAIAGPVTIADTTKSLVAQSYAFLSGANVVFIDDYIMRNTNGRFSPTSKVLFLAVNLCILILVIFISLS